jgi:DGQHR domain-containing protein
MIEKCYFGCRLFQRIDQQTVAFFVFYARAKDIKEWAGIRRVSETDDGIQRVLRASRQKAITRFLKSSSLNTIPGNILLAFNPDTAHFNSLSSRFLKDSPEIDIFNNCQPQLDWGTLKFQFEVNTSEQLKPALIVDGQHRLYGISDFVEENLPLLIVSLIDAPIQEQAFQFVVINNKAVRVPTDNVRAIIAQIDEDELQKRLLEAGVSYGEKSPILRDINDLSTSPFQNLLNWPYNKKGSQLVPLTAIEQSLRFLQGSFPTLSDDEDSLIEIFCAIWRAVKSNYSNIWGYDNKFMKKVNINALNEFVADRLKYAWELDLIDIFNSQAVEQQVLNIVKLLPEEFWEEEWTVNIQDNANVRNLIKADLATLASNSRLRKSWREDLKLPTSKILNEED